LSTHPDFDAAAANHRWTRPLAELKAELRAAAFRARGRWAWYILPHGAVVSMRVDENAFPYREMRIARRDAPKDDKARAAWQREIDTFREHLDVMNWRVKETRTESASSGPGIEVVLVESFRPVVSPPPAGPLCARCGNPATDGPHPEKLCNRCALAAGQAEIAEKGHAR
jgi:hypothetical protein